MVSSMAKAGFGLGVIGLIAVLAVSVVTLVKVYNKDDSTVNNYYTNAPGANGDSNETIIYYNETEIYNNTVIYNNTYIYLSNGSDPGAALNIPPNSPSGTEKYKQAAKFFANSIDISVSPCDDFYQYACGKYNQSISFDIAELDNFMKMANSLNTPNSNDPTPLVQIKKMYQQCLKDTPNMGSITADGSLLMNVYNDFQAQTTLPFPLLNRTQSMPFPNSTALSRILGYLSGKYNVDTLISQYVDTNWKDPQGLQPYLLFLDQPVLSLPWTYYIGKTWDISKPSLITRVNQTFYNFNALLNQTKLDLGTLDLMVNNIVNFEYLLANNYSSDAITRWQSDRSYNLIKLSDFNSKYQAFDIMTYMRSIATNVDPNNTAVLDRIMDQNYEISIAEPTKLRNMSDAINNNFNGQVDAVTFANYMYYRLLDANSNLFPSAYSIKKDEFLDMYKMKRPTRGKPRYEKGIRSKVSKVARDTADDELKLVCVEDTIDYFQYANARIFIDVIYPDATSRANIKSSVGHIVDSILVNMQGMIDQLSWMSADSKKGAYSKIQNLVRNIAYPDWLADNQKLTNYYADLPSDFGSKTSYLDMLNALNVFNTQLAFNQLARTNGTDREDWNGPPGIVNAWYQPELNSISFPAAILRQPFFDQDWPASVNYGAMGVVAGHELSHGFDSSGTQWNGFGQLLGWLDSNSQQYFNNMTQCVIDEYNQFCPLNTSYSPNCINGQQTVGENVADNGGIHAAFRAYRNTLNFFGPDPRLPGDLMSLLTHDQLFFLSFAQVWCQLPDPAARTYRQLLVDPHSPSKYRVFGTIQNFPAFRTAFNCPADSASAPKKHCNVWISDVNISQEEASSNVLNIPEAPAIKADDNLYTKYSQAQAFFKASLNLSADPCQDFYSYACGSYNKPLSFTVYRDRNYEIMANKTEELLQPSGNEGMKNSTAINKLLSFYKKCKSTIVDLNNRPEIKNGSVVKKVLDDFKDLTGYTFNLCDTSSQNTNDDPTVLAKALAYLSVKFGINTFVTPFVDVNARRNNNFAANFTLYLDQSTLTYDKSYYQDQAFTSYTKDVLTKNARMLIQSYTYSIGHACQFNATNKIVDDIVRLEQQLATTYSTDDNTRRDFTRWINPMEVNELANNFNLTDWRTFISSLANYTGVPFVDDSTVDNYLLLVAEPEIMANMTDYIQNTVGIDGVVKYLYYRLLLSQQSFVYQPPGSTYTSMYDESSFAIGQKTRARDPYAEKIAINSNMTYCAEATQNYMQYANARIFTEALYKDESEREYIRNETFNVISAIRDSMQAMLDNLAWIKMDAQTQQGARDKIMDLQLNLAFPDFVMDNTLLDEYYDTLDIDDTVTYFDMLNRLQVFNQYQTYINLTSDYINRADFLGPPGTVNAWYQPELNSITIPEGILQQPYFDPEWPASLKFGAMGMIVGHELTHGFDDQGVQWDGMGVLETWMSPAAQQEFSNMAKCVVDEYNNFTAITNPAYQPNHINGAQTQGENIADNGGIHSGYLSYQRWTQLNGPDPRLPGRVYSQFTHDQLYFLGFAQAWCQAPPSDAALYRQLLIDPHSPSKFRVFGTLQNFPAFRQAFNCPVGSAYAPKDHCSVWVPKK